MENLDDESVELTVTSPPYPMIEIWDDMFSEMNDRIQEKLDAEQGHEAFKLMHKELEKVWEEVVRVTAEGGIVCVNIGDATRKIGDHFQLFPNHKQVVEFFTESGFRQLPAVLWRKPTNKASKFMGSGMLPTNAYVTLEHEYILIFRKGGNRKFRSGSKTRYRSAYFWEERNQWFSDVWMNIRGTIQKLANSELRNRAAAYPFEIPYRLINMYSVQGDTVLDPFWGTGTTSIAAMASARNSIGYEIEEGFGKEFKKQAQSIEKKTTEVNTQRLRRHHDFVQDQREKGKDWKYDAENYDFPVMTKQEKQIQLKGVESAEPQENGYVIEHTDFTEEDMITETKQTTLDQ
jgi:DNA modification methylase